MDAGTRCTSCGGGELVARKRYRLGEVVVAVGYGGLVMSGLAIFASMVMVLFAIDGMRGKLLEEVAVPQTEVLRVAGVPPEVIRKVAEAEAVTAADRVALTAHQLRLIAGAQQQVAATRAATGAAADTARVNATVVAVFCTVTGGLSLLLLTREKVLQCEHCGEVVT
jgi:hypothetical protein